MGSLNWGIVLIAYSILTHLSGLTIGQELPFPISSTCTARGNYTQNSPYRRNLDDVLSSLPQTNNGYGFLTSSVGQGDEPDAAYAIALCRGDINSDTCVECVANATRELRQSCPNQKVASQVYSNCTLSYSNSTLLYAYNGGTVMFWKIENDTDLAQFDQSLGKLFQQLRGEAAKGGYFRKYASGNVTVPGSKTNIYGTVQCRPDLSESYCNECLVTATKLLPYGRTGGIVYYSFSCTCRYDTNLFYGPTWYPPPPSPPLQPTHPPPISSLTTPPPTTLRPAEDLFSASEDGTGEMNYFKLSALQAVTNNFSLANKLGEGGFGPVYWGELPDGKKIAVKRLSQNSSQGLEEFKTEVKLIIKLQHKNLVRLLGCCIKGNERLLVYEYMANNSLDVFLFDPRLVKELEWSKRANIVAGIAKGLRYLHEDSRLKIIHRDLKTSNILLDEDMHPKISDFGTARIFGVNQVDANTNRVVGTYGYMAPEYAMDGLFSIKSDVYSFGVMLLEIISGKRNDRSFHQEHDQNLLSYAWNLWEEGKGEQLIDGNLNDDCPVSEALKWMNIALLCIQEDPKDRPTMSSVVFWLEGELTTLPEPELPMSFSKFDQSSSIGGDIGLSSSDRTRHEETNHKDKEQIKKVSLLASTF